MIVPQLALPEAPAAPPDPAAAPMRVGPRPQSPPQPQPRIAVPRAAEPPRFTPKKIAAWAGGTVVFCVLFYFGQPLRRA